MTTALAWLERPADLVCRLGEIVVGVDVSTPDLPANGRHMEKVIRVEDDGGALLDWLEAEAEARWPDLDPETRLGNHAVRRLYKTLLSDLRDACTIVVQAMLGLRISEVAGLKADPAAPGTGWPDCIRVRPSLSGLNEVFYVKSYVFKGRPSAELTEWVAGSRPCGTEYLPSAVKAIAVLQEAFFPWRRCGYSEELLVGLGGGLNPHVIRKNIVQITSRDLYVGQRRFVRRRVELPESHRGWRISTHQWRKSFALYMVRSDERQLAAVSDHFKHLSVASTDQSYVGNDAELLGLMRDVGVRSAAKTLLDACEGKVSISGRMAETVEERAPHILKACEAFGSEGQKVERLTEMLKDDDIRIWPSPWGGCLFRTEKAKCHLEAQGKVEMRARQPDHGHRHPDICCSCANHLVTDAHGDFWRERHAEAKAFVDTCRIDDNPEGAAAAERRVKAAAGVLDKLQRRSAKRIAGGRDAGR